MKSRSEISSSGRPIDGPTTSDRGVESDWMTRPIHLSGASVVNRTAPAPIEQHDDRHTEVCSVRAAVDGRPPMMAGTASTGSANAVAIWSPVEAVSAAAASPPSNPALRSITTVNGVAEPGTMPAERVASQLGARDREPTVEAERDAVDLPQADRARDLEQEHQERERPVEMFEGAPRREDRDQAR